MSDDELRDGNTAHVDSQRTISLADSGLPGYKLATLVIPDGSVTYALVNIEHGDDRHTFSEIDIPRERLGPLIGGWRHLVQAVMHKHGHTPHSRKVQP